MFVWLFGWLVVCWLYCFLIDGLVVWFLGCVFLRSVGRSVRLCFVCSVSWLVSRSVCQSVSRSVGRSVGQSVGQSVSQSVGQAGSRVVAGGGVRLEGKA